MPNEQTNAKETKVLELKQYKKLVPAGQDPEVYLKLVKEQVGGAKLTTEDFNLFLYVCKRTGLDPLTRQIYAVARWDTSLGRNKMAIQTGIDGFRLTAERSKKYAGMEDIKYLPEDETATFPTKATCTVYKMVDGQKVAYTASARWDEYVQKNKDGSVAIMWAKMPYTMLGKCAEALALRKAFPNELSGIYADVEMTQSDTPTSGLEAPEKFKKTETITVEHGAPTDLPKEPAKTEVEKNVPISQMRKDLKESTENEQTKEEPKKDDTAKNTNPTSKSGK